MSHFSVGVIVKTPDDLVDALAPFNEQDEQYFVREPQMTLKDYMEWDKFKKSKEQYIQDLKKAYGDDFDEAKEIVYGNFNPNAKWDWYSIGGRWRYSLKVRKSAEHIKDLDLMGDTIKDQKGKYIRVDGAKIKDIKWNKILDKNKTPAALGKFWDDYVDPGLHKTEYPTEEYNAEYYLNKYKTKEQYVNLYSKFYTYALYDDITEEWIEPGEVGWFGTNNSTIDSLKEYVNKFYEIIESPDYQDYWFIVVDCHI